MNRRLSIITLLLATVFILALSSFAEDGPAESTTALGLLKDPEVEASPVYGPICLPEALLHISREYGISPKLVEAIIQVESQGNPQAVSPRGALGLMQLTPEVLKACQVADPFDPLANIRAGVRHLHYLLWEFSGDLSLALAAYNAGAAAVRQYGGIPPYPETQKYLQSVLREYQSEGIAFGSFVENLKVKMESIKNIHGKNHLIRGSDELFTLLQIPMTAPLKARIP
jgi:soluble lytic murein transglycosylase-like protein